MSDAPRFLRFGLVGTVGFGVDGALVFILVAQGMDALLARAFSFPTAVLVTWWLNRTWTFETRSNTEARRQFTAYFLVQIVGMLINLAVYAVVLHLIGASPVNALFALAVGSLVGLLANYTGSRFLVFSSAAQSGELPVE